MSHSLNEIEAMAKRAARGGGLAWGLAEETGKATRWLAGLALPATTMLADVLDLSDGQTMADYAPISLDGDWQSSAGVLNPLIAGASLSDCAARLADNGRIDMNDVAYPLFIVPFAGWAAQQLGTPVAISWDNVQVVADGMALCVQDPDNQLLADRTARLSCTSPAKMSAPRPVTQRGQPDPDGWARLGQYAHRTYAPATDESRLLGAGAGLNDND